MHDSTAVIIGTTVIIALIIAVGYLFFTRPSGTTSGSSGSGSGSGSSGPDAGAVALKALGGALAGAGGALA